MFGGKDWNAFVICSSVFVVGVVVTETVAVAILNECISMATFFSLAFVTFPQSRSHIFGLFREIRLHYSYKKSYKRSQTIWMGSFLFWCLSISGDFFSTDGRPMFNIETLVRTLSFVSLQYRQHWCE